MQQTEFELEHAVSRPHGGDGAANSTIGISVPLVKRGHPVNSPFEDSPFE